MIYINLASHLSITFELRLELQTRQFTTVCHSAFANNYLEHVTQ